MLRIADGWKDYAVIATGDGYKLERWGEYTLLRPDPQVIWSARRDPVLLSRAGRCLSAQ